MALLILLSVTFLVFCGIFAIAHFLDETQDELEELRRWHAEDKS